MANASRKSRLLPRLYMTPLNRVSCHERPPPVVLEVLGAMFQGEFDIRNR